MKQIDLTKISNAAYRKENGWLSGTDIRRIYGITNSDTLRRYVRKGAIPKPRYEAVNAQKMDVWHQDDIAGITQEMVLAYRPGIGGPLGKRNQKPPGRPKIKEGDQMDYACIHLKGEELRLMQDMQNFMKVIFRTGWRAYESEKTI